MQGSKQALQQLENRKTVGSFEENARGMPEMLEIDKSPGGGKIFSSRDRWKWEKSEKGTTGQRGARTHNFDLGLEKAGGQIGHEITKTARTYITPKTGNATLSIDSTWEIRIGLEKENGKGCIST